MDRTFQVGGIGHQIEANAVEVAQVDLFIADGKLPDAPGDGGGGSEQERIGMGWAVGAQIGVAVERVDGPVVDGALPGGIFGEVAVAEGFQKLGLQGEGKQQEPEEAVHGRLDPLLQC